MSILGADDVYVWRERPPCWSRDREEWDQMQSSHGQYLIAYTIMAKCYDNICRSCCVCTDADSCICQCGASLTTPPAGSNFRTPAKRCPECGSTILMCHFGIRGIAIPIIQSQPEDII